jgi:2,3-bisphosphoglycerate-dependent phosphoglycerate mutase
VTENVIEVVFETHMTSQDNERGIATGWLPGRLSDAGREQARELGARRSVERMAAIFTSDLARAVETAEIAFAGLDIPILHDWRLRECNYGDRNGMPAEELHRGRAAHLDRPYPNGESWRRSTARVGRFVEDLRLGWNAEDRVLVIGHVATRWGLDHNVHGVALEQLVNEEFVWQPGWRYRVTVDK